MKRAATWNLDSLVVIGFRVIKVTFIFYPGKAYTKDKRGLFSVPIPSSNRKR